MSERLGRSIWIGVMALALVWVAAGGEAALAAKTEAGKATASAPIDLNRATAEELTLVPGIGKVMAERIIAFREEHGPFTRVEDLMKVKGIGEKSFEKLRDHVKVSGSR